MFIQLVCHSRLNNFLENFIRLSMTFINVYNCDTIFSGRTYVGRQSELEKMIIALDKDRLKRVLQHESLDDSLDIKEKWESEMNITISDELWEETFETRDQGCN